MLAMASGVLLDGEEHKIGSVEWDEGGYQSECGSCEDSHDLGRVSGWHVRDSSHVHVKS